MGKGLLAVKISGGFEDAYRTRNYVYLSAAVQRHDTAGNNNNNKAENLIIAMSSVMLVM
jgi:hypothetical protein